MFIFKYINISKNYLSSYRLLDNNCNHVINYVDVYLFTSVLFPTCYYKLIFK